MGERHAVIAHEHHQRVCLLSAFLKHGDDFAKGPVGTFHFSAVLSEILADARQVRQVARHLHSGGIDPARTRVPGMMWIAEVNPKEPRTAGGCLSEELFK